MLKILLVLAAATLGLGACTAHRHYADPDQREYAYDGRYQQDGPPGTYGETPYAEDPYAGERDDVEGYDGYDGYGAYAPEPPRRQLEADRGCHCDCNCCDRHARRLEPRRYDSGPVVPVVPRDPADWLE